MGRRVIHFLSWLWFADFSSSVDFLSSAPLSPLRGEDGDSISQACVSPGNTRWRWEGYRSGIRDSLFSHRTCMGWVLQVGSRMWTWRWTFVHWDISQGLWHGGGGWWLTPMGGKGGGRAGQSEKLTRSLADPLGCSTARVILQGVPRWGGGPVPLCPRVDHLWDVAAFGRRQCFGPGSHPGRLRMDGCLPGTEPRSWGLLTARESLDSTR